MNFSQLLNTCPFFILDSSKNHFGDKRIKRDSEHGFIMKIQNEDNFSISVEHSLQH